MVTLRGRQAGTHTPQQTDVAGPAITELLVVMGPRLRGDDSGVVRAKKLSTQDARGK
jgi:hypothetical protein